MHQVWTLSIDYNNNCFNRLILGLINNNSIHNYSQLVSKSLKLSSPMKRLKSHKKCSQVEISNLSNFCLKFGTHEEELEPILLTKFQQKVHSYPPVGCVCQTKSINPSLVVFLLFVSVVVFFDLVTTQTCL